MKWTAFRGLPSSFSMGPVEEAVADGTVANPLPLQIPQPGNGRGHPGGAGGKQNGPACIAVPGAHQGKGGTVKLHPHHLVVGQLGPQGLGLGHAGGVKLCPRDGGQAVVIVNALGLGKAAGAAAHQHGLEARPLEVKGRRDPGRALAHNDCVFVLHEEDLP